MSLRAVDLRLGYEARTVVDHLDLEIVPGVTAIVGPNGCGKSTLLRAFGRLLAPRAGRAELDGDDVRRIPTRALARRLALLPQTTTAPAGLTVAELVGRGRYAHQSLLRASTAQDRAVVAETLAQVGLTELADRPLDQLSGGQRQRAWIGMTLAQRAEVLLLDEPTTFLDLAHQIEVLDLVHALTGRSGLTTVMVLHDLSLAARYADRLVVMRAGAVVAAGPPREVLTASLLQDAFGLEARVLTDPGSGDPIVVPATAVVRGGGGPDRVTADPREIPSEEPMTSSRPVTQKEPCP